MDKIWGNGKKELIALLVFIFPTAFLITILGLTKTSLT